jgi:hypothetical protein
MGRKKTTGAVKILDGVEVAPNDTPIESSQETLPTTSAIVEGNDDVPSEQVSSILSEQVTETPTAEEATNLPKKKKQQKSKTAQDPPPDKKTKSKQTPPPPPARDTSAVEEVQETELLLPQTPETLMEPEIPILDAPPSTPSPEEPTPTIEDTPLQSIVAPASSSTWVDYTLLENEVNDVVVVPAEIPPIVYESPMIPRFVTMVGTPTKFIIPPQQPKVFQRMRLFR